MKLPKRFSNILFSIIVPIHNAEKTLNHCVKSILKQNFSKIEIILINDFSSDASKKICNSFKKKYKNIKVLNNKKKLGVSISRNKGIRKAKGDFLIFLDSDDFLIKNCLIDISKIIEKRYKSDLIIAKKFVTLSMSNTFITHKVFRNINLNGNNTKNPIHHFIREKQIYGNIFIFIISRKFLIEKKIYFMPKVNFGEDQEFVAKILCFCSKYILYNKSFYCYSSGVGNLSNSMSLNTALSCLKVVNNLKNMDKLNSLSIIKRRYIKKIINKVLNQFIPRLIYYENKNIFKLSKYIESKKKNFKSLKYSFSKIEISSSLKKYGYNQGLIHYKNTIINRLLVKLNKKLKFFNDIYIFCYNYNGIAISKILLDNGYNLRGFLDNNKLLYKNKILGLKVYSPNILKGNKMNNKLNTSIIICNQFKRNINNISRQLIASGIKKKKIVYKYT